MVREDVLRVLAGRHQRATVFARKLVVKSSFMTFKRILEIKILTKGEPNFKGEKIIKRTELSYNYHVFEVPFLTFVT